MPRSGSTSSSCRRGYLFGNLLLEPSLPLEDGRAKLGTLGLGYLRSIDLFGMAGRVGSRHTRPRRAPGRRTLPGATPAPRARVSGTRFSNSTSTSSVPRRSRWASSFVSSVHGGRRFASGDRTARPVLSRTAHQPRDEPLVVHPAPRRVTGPRPLARRGVRERELLHHQQRLLRRSDARAGSVSTMSRPTRSTRYAARTCGSPGPSATAGAAARLITASPRARSRTSASRGSCVCRSRADTG